MCIYLKNLYLQILWFHVISCYFWILIINQPCWKKYYYWHRSGRSTHWIFSSWWMQVCRGADGDQFGSVWGGWCKGFLSANFPHFIGLGDGWNRNLSGEKVGIFYSKHERDLKSWGFPLWWMSFCVFFWQDFAEVGEILFNLTRLIIWMVCVCNMMKLFDVRLPF